MSAERVLTEQRRRKCLSTLRTERMFRVKSSSVRRAAETDVAAINLGDMLYKQNTQYVITELKSAQPQHA